MLAVLCEAIYFLPLSPLVSSRGGEDEDSSHCMRTVVLEVTRAPGFQGDT
jgi:hypothetical protein